MRAAAAAGYQVIAADAYGDADTRQVAAQSLRLVYRQGGFDAVDTCAQLLPLMQGACGLVYGSGFETQPDLLATLAEQCALYGNQPETVRIAKDPDRFFSLLSRLDIPFPAVSRTPPTDARGWLSKRVGGSGGTHVVPMAEEGGADRYYQREIPGEPASLLFLADGRNVRAVGYNRQLLAPLAEMPYRYGGAVSQWPLPLAVSAAMHTAATAITHELGLRGLNSLDCVVEGESISVLEINPRLSATFALYDEKNEGAVLFEAHMQACLGQLPVALPPEPAQAHLIYYAPFSLTAPATSAWPEWVADLPEPASRIAADEPLCSVLASAPDAAQALALAQARVAALTRLVANF